MGAVFAYFTAQATAAIKRVALSYGLLAVAALITIFALGYAIDAGHTALALRFGLVSASSIAAAALLAIAGGCGVTAYFIQGRPRARVSSASSPYSHPPYPQLNSRQLLIGMGTGLAGVFSVAALLFRLRSRRSRRERNVSGEAIRHGAESR